MHGFNDLLHMTFHVIGHSLRDITALHQSVHHRGALGHGRSGKHLHRLAEQMQLLAQFHMLEVQIAGGWRQIVCGDRCQCLLAVLLRRAVGIAGVRRIVHTVEPLHIGAKHAMIGQNAAHIIRHGAQILADHHAAGARGLDGQYAEHRLVVVHHVGAIAGAKSLRNPPQAEQSQHVIDTHRARMLIHGMHHFAVHLVAGGFQITRVERWLAPILALLVVEVRRAADRDATGGETLRVGPRVSAEPVHANGHILHKAKCHAMIQGRVLSVVHLLGGDPLQPAVELEQIMMVLDQRLHGRVVDGLLEEPAVLAPGCAPHLEAQAPGGEGIEVRAGHGLEMLELQLALVVAARIEDQAQGRALGLPRRVDIHRRGFIIACGHRGMQCIHLSAHVIRQGGVFGNVLRANVRHVEEPARFRQIRRRLERRNRRTGVNWIDEHEVGLGLLGGIRQKTLQIAVVADAPGIVGAYRIHLRHPAPALMLLNRLRHGDACGGGDDGRLAFASVNRDGQRVVTHRQVGGDGEIRLAGVEIRQ